MAILRSSHKAGKTTPPQGKSFMELLSRLGQRSQLAAPKYADSTKHVNGFVWGFWTRCVYSLGFIHRLGIGRLRRQTACGPTHGSTRSGVMSSEFIGIRPHATTTAFGPCLNLTPMRPWLTDRSPIQILPVVGWFWRVKCIIKNRSSKVHKGPF